MKIGFFTDGYLPQAHGVATSVETTARALERLGHKVYIAAPKEPGFKDRKNVFRLTSLRIATKPEFRFAIQLPEKPVRQLLKIDFDIIHGHAGGPVTFLGWQIAKIKNVPFIVTYHTLWNRYTHYFLNGKLLSPKMMEIATRVGGNLCDYIVAPTQRVKEELVSYGVKKPIVVIPSGIDLNRFSAAKKGFLREKLKLKKEQRILLFVGRIGQEKSVDFLVLALKWVVKKCPDVCLVMVGDGPDKEKLERLAKQLKVENHLRFAGTFPQKDMPKIYADATLFLFSSTTETQGLVVIEALASGLPVVAVKDEAFEGVILDGKNGYLTVKRPSVFANKVILLLNDEKLRKTFSSKARKHVQKFSVDQAALELLNLYRQALKKHKRQGKVVYKVKEKLSNLKNFLSLTAKINKFKGLVSVPISWRKES